MDTHRYKDKGTGYLKLGTVKRMRTNSVAGAEPPAVSHPRQACEYEVPRMRKVGYLEDRQTTCQWEEGMEILASHDKIQM